MYREEREFEPVPEDAAFRSILARAARPGRLTFIVGEPGAGKSRLMEEWYRRGAALAAEAPRLGMVLPVLVALGQLTPETWRPSDTDLATALWRQSIDARSYLDVCAAQTYVPEAAYAVTPVWLLDGLDEAPSGIPVDEVFFQRLANLPGVKVVTCRTAAYEGLRAKAASFREGERGEYHLLPLRPEQQAEFLRGALPVEPERAAALHQSIQGNAQLRLLAGSPLLLRLIAELCEPEDLPLTRAEFYRCAVEGMWNRRLGGARPYGALAAARDAALLELARGMGLARISDALPVLGQAAARAGIGLPHDLEHSLETSGILAVDRRLGRFSFVHLTFQEYYLARTLRTGGLRDALDRYWDKPRYEETLALLVSLIYEDGDRQGIVEAVSEFAEHWRRGHQRNPQTLWKIGRSPLRTVLHVLWRSGVPLEDGALGGVIDPVLGRWGLRLASDPRIPFSVLPWLTANRVPHVRSGVARNPSASGELLAGLAADPEELVRWGVALNPRAPAELLARLAADGDVEVRELVAENPSASAELLARLAAAPYAGIRKIVARNPSAPAELLARLAADPDADVRRVVAGNQNASAELLARLVADSDEGVRRDAAENPSAPAEFLARLAADSDEAVRWGVARNRNAPPVFLARLAADPDVRVRWGVARNPNASGELLARLAADPDEAVRWAVALNPSAPAELLARLANPEMLRRRAVAQNPSASAELLAGLAADPEWFVRWGVAENPSASAELLAQLAADPVEGIRKGVAENPSAPAELLARLAADPNSDVRGAVARNPNALLEDS